MLFSISLFHCNSAAGNKSCAVSPSRYCGERPQFVVASNTNRITVQFHSDQSYTDTGFSAEFLSYDSSDRKSN